MTCIGDVLNDRFLVHQRNRPTNLYFKQTWVNTTISTPPNNTRIREIGSLWVYTKNDFILKDLHFLSAKLPDRCNIVIFLFRPRGSKGKKYIYIYPAEWAQVNQLNICGQTLNEYLPYAVINWRKTHLQSTRNDKGLKQTGELELYFPIPSWRFKYDPRRFP